MRFELLVFGRGRDLLQVAVRHSDRRVHGRDTRDTARQHDVALGRVDHDRLVGQDIVELALQRLQVVGDLDVDRADQVVAAIPQQDVRRADVLAEHVELRRPENQDVCDIRAADRDACRAHFELDGGRLEQRHRQALVLAIPQSGFLRLGLRLRAPAAGEQRSGKQHEGESYLEVIHRTVPRFASTVLL